jgi:hypothetical protein
MGLPFISITYSIYGVPAITCVFAPTIVCVIYEIVAVDDIIA